MMSVPEIVELKLVRTPDWIRSTLRNSVTDKATAKTVSAADVPRLMRLFQARRSRAGFMP